MSIEDMLTDFKLTPPAASDNSLHAIAVHIGWLNWGNVGDESFSKLVEHFKAEKIAEFERPGDFYNFITYRERSFTYTDNDGVRQTNFPNSRVFYVKREAPQADLLLLSLLEPTQFGEIYADKVVNLLKKLKVDRYQVVGAMGSPVPHSRPIRVTGRSSDPLITERLKQIGVRTSTGGSSYSGPTSIFNAVTGQMPEAGITTVNLMAHMPSHISLHDTDFNGVFAILNILSKLEDIDISLERIESRGKRQYDRVNGEVKASQSMMKLSTELEEIYDQEEERSAEESVQLPPSIQQAIDDALNRE